MTPGIRAHPSFILAKPELDRSELVTRFGGPVSHVLLDRETESFEAGSIEGAIAYRHGLGCAVAIGDPICSAADTARLADAFRAYCRRRGWRTMYAIASERFASWASGRGYAALEFGRELIVDPRVDPLAGSSAQRLRGKVRRAEREGVVVNEYRGGDPALSCAMADAERAWLDARRGLQLYLSNLDLFEGGACKRWWYAQHGDRVVGLLQVVRLDAFDGYLLSRLFATPAAPPGTTELLGVTGLRALGAEGCGYATWGPAPSGDLGNVSNLGALSERVGRAIFRAASRAFKLEARNVYRRKFPVDRTEGAYVLFDPPRIRARQVIEVMHAFHASSW